MNQYEINKEIEALVMSKDNFSPEELQYIFSYTGMGGLEKYGAESSPGLLHEYYTPAEVIKKMWALAIKFGFNGGKVLEPSAGVGRVLTYDNNKAVAYETSPISAKICTLINPNAEVRQKSFSQHFYDDRLSKFNPNFEKDFNLVIGNPPYGEFNDINSFSEKKHFNLPNMRFDQYFILRGLDCLVSGGFLVYVVTDNLFNGKYPEVESAIEAKSEILDAYLLPDQTFTTTKIPTALIVLRKR